jgi:hypothetical protein
MILDHMSSLTDELAGSEPWRLTGAELRQHLIGAVRVRTSLDAYVSLLAGCAEGMGLAKDDGATSTTAWVAQVTGMSKGEASKFVALAKVTTPESEATRAAWATGRLSTDKASVIMKAVDALPEWCGEEERRDAEAHLIRLAGEYGLDGLQRLANRVLEVIDPDGADEEVGRQLREQEKRAFDATRMKLARRGDGTTRGAFVIPDADADVLRAAIEAILSPRRNTANAELHKMGLDDWKTLPRDEKMGHAFTELINHLPSSSLPQAGGLAATVAVTVDIDDLRTGQGVAHNSSGTDISATKAQRLACNAHLVALYLENGTRVIDHGMTRRLYDRHQRLALAVRDQGCVFPACDRPPAWCEAHHLDFWSEGGPTNLDNAALLCHFHHFLVHEGDWEAQMGDDGIVEVIPPARIDPRRRPRRHARFTQQQPRAA